MEAKSSSASLSGVSGQTPSFPGCSVMPADTPIVAHVAASMSGSPQRLAQAFSNFTQPSGPGEHAPKRSEMRGAGSDVWLIAANRIHALVYDTWKSDQEAIDHGPQNAFGRSGPSKAVHRGIGSSRVAIGDDAAWWYRKRDLSRGHGDF